MEREFLLQLVFDIIDLDSIWLMNPANTQARKYAATS